MLFITFCTGWILKKRTIKLVVLQKYKKSNTNFFKFSNYTARRPFWSTKKTCLCNRYREILFQEVALGYLLHFVQNGSSKSALETYFVARKCHKTEKLETCPIYSPLPPDQPPFKGGLYVSFELNAPLWDAPYMFASWHGHYTKSCHGPILYDRNPSLRQMPGIAGDHLFLWGDEQCLASADLGRADVPGSARPRSARGSLFWSPVHGLTTVTAV